MEYDRGYDNDRVNKAHKHVAAEGNLQRRKKALSKRPVRSNSTDKRCLNRT